jgi:predicted phosphodiesterase
MQRTLVVGDVHGCREELEDLLKVAGFGKGDRLVLAGDLVAKGPDSQGVVQLARELEARAVLGNHDAHLLGAREGKPSKKRDEALVRSMTGADWDYLEQLPLYLELSELGAVVAHGGLVPGVPLAEQERNVVINLRSFDEKGRPSARIEGGVPWASRWPGPALVLFGHDAVRGLQRYPHALGLDSGCVYGKALSAVWLPERRLVQVPARRVWQKPD